MNSAYKYDILDDISSYDSLDDVIDKLIKARERARVNGWVKPYVMIESVYEYGGSDLRCRIVGKRPLSTQEQIIKAQEDLKVQQLNEERDRKEFERLKKKYT